MFRSLLIRQLKHIRPLLAASVLSLPVAAEPQTLSLWNRNFDTAPVNEVLELALKKTEDLYPPLTIQRTPPMEYQQALQALLTGTGEPAVFSAAASEILENELITVRFPVLKGLLGNRICLIRKGEQARFRPVQTAFDMTQQKLSVCQGRNWPDTDVLQRNGFTVKTAGEYQTLFTMLEKGECDCFLRGAQEILPEYERYKDRFDIEQHLLFRYPQPGYFYLNHNSRALAMRIELGLWRALDDGSFDALFDRLSAGWEDTLQFGQRVVIPLNNPNLSAASKQLGDIKELWYQP